MSKWPLKYRAWQKLHGIFNRLAHKYADPGGPAWGKAYRTDHNKLLWRLNDFCGSRYISWMVEQRTGISGSRDKMTWACLLLGHQYQNRAEWSSRCLRGDEQAPEPPKPKDSDRPLPAPGRQ